MSATDRTAADFEAAASALVHFRVRCEGLSHGEEVFLVPLAGGPSKVRLCLCACVCACVRCALRYERDYERTSLEDLPYLVLTLALSLVLNLSTFFVHLARLDSPPPCTRRPLYTRGITLWLPSVSRSPLAFWIQRCCLLVPLVLVLALVLVLVLPQYTSVRCSTLPIAWRYIERESFTAGKNLRMDRLRKNCTLLYKVPDRKIRLWTIPKPPSRPVTRSLFI